MKKTKTIISLITLTVALFLIKPIPVYAWDDCPKGKVNDPYPGDCARYIDTDGNGICDHSEPAPEDRVQEVQPEPENTPTPIATNTPTNTIAPKTNSAKNETSKVPLAIGITTAHLVGILAYITYKNKSARNKAYEKN